MKKTLTALLAFWNRGTVNGVSTVLPGLVIRGESNDEICREGLT